MTHRIAIAILALCHGTYLHAQLAAKAVPETNALQTNALRTSVYLDGSIRAAAENPEQSSIATGAIGIAFTSTKSSLTAQINVAAKGDTIRSAPGSTMLVPGSGGFSSGFLEGHLRVPNIRSWHSRNPWLKRLFFRGYVSATSTVWELPERVVGGATEPAIALGANPLGWGAGLSYNIQGNFVDVADASVGLKFDLGFVQRLLHGDIVDSRFTDRRIAFLGSAERSFSGFELGMRLGFRDIVGSLTYYTLPWQGGVHGLTKGQIAAGFAISAAILEGNFSELP